MMSRIAHTICRIRADSEGASLAEVAVAMTLLVAVLVPTVVSAVALLNASGPGVRAEALVRATTALESVLATNPEVWQSTTEVDGSWQVAREVTSQGAYVAISVSISRVNGPPLVTLSTGRSLTAPLAP